MIFYYLIAPILMVSGQPNMLQPIHVFTVEADCLAAGEQAAATVRSRADIKQGIWQCLPVDFDLLDPLPEAPAGAPLPEQKKAGP